MVHRCRRTSDQKTRWIPFRAVLESKHVKKEMKAKSRRWNRNLDTVFKKSRFLHFSWNGERRLENNWRIRKKKNTKKKKTKDIWIIHCNFSTDVVLLKQTLYRLFALKIYPSTRDDEVFFIEGYTGIQNNFFHSMTTEKSGEFWGKYIFAFIERKRKRISVNE